MVGAVLECVAKFKAPVPPRLVDALNQTLNLTEAF